MEIWEKTVNSIFALMHFTEMHTILIDLSMFFQPSLRVICEKLLLEDITPQSREILQTLVWWGAQTFPPPYKRL